MTDIQEKYTRGGDKNQRERFYLWERYRCKCSLNPKGLRVNKVAQLALVKMAKIAELTNLSKVLIRIFE